MALETFIWLGSKRSRKHPIGDKGKLLDIAASRGLPVPSGGILLHELYQLLRDADVLSQQGQRVTAREPNWLYETFYEEIRFPRLEKPVAVRAAFASTGMTAANSHSHHTAVPQLNVNFLNPTALSNSLCAVWSGALRQPGGARQDVLVMEMALRQVTGTAVTYATHAHDSAYFQRETSAAALEMPKLSGWKRPSPDLPPFAQRLQQLLRGVRRTFGPTNWQIEWVDDGKICWLLQVTSV